MSNDKSSKGSGITAAAQKVAEVARSLVPKPSKPAGSPFSRKGGGPGSKSRQK